MTLFDFLLFVVALLLGVRVGVWYATKQAEAQAQIQSVNTRIDMEGEAISRRLNETTAALDRRIDDTTQDLWRRVNELENQFNELKEKK